MTVRVGQWELVDTKRRQMMDYHLEYMHRMQQWEEEKVEEMFRHLRIEERNYVESHRDEWASRTYPPPSPEALAWWNKVLHWGDEHLSGKTPDPVTEGVRKPNKRSQTDRKTEGD